MKNVLKANAVQQKLKDIRLEQLELEHVIKSPCAFIFRKICTNFYCFNPIGNFGRKSCPIRTGPAQGTRN